MSVAHGNQAQQTERAARAEVTLACEIKQGSSPWIRVVLHDISATGFRIDWRPGLSESQPMAIRIPGLQPLNAYIRWKRESWMGCEFSAQLYAPVYDHIVRLAEG